MTDNKSFDYYSECLTYLKLKKSGTRTTQQAYCKRRAAESGLSVSLQYFKKVLAKVRRDQNPRLSLTKNSPGTTAPSTAAAVLKADPGWPDLHDAYVQGKFASLSDVARHLGLRPDHRGFREAAKGWRDERRALAPAVSTRTVEQLAHAGAVARVRDLYAEALVAYYSLLDLVTDSALNAKERWKDRDKTPWHTQMAAQAAMDLAKAMAQLLPAIKGLENLRLIHEIFDNLSAGGDIVKAALELAKLGVSLPKPVEILLAKHKTEEVSPDDGTVVTDEEIMRRRAEMLAEIQRERTEFVPERKKIVAELKAATADSFRAQREIETEP
jgi:hypothetical protein